MILYCVLKHAYEYNIFYYARRIDLADDWQFNGTFYEMLENIVEPNLFKKYDELKQKEIAVFKESKRSLTEDFVEGKIDIETLVKSTQKLFDEFHKKIKELDNDLKTYSTIQTRLKNDLASFDMTSFKNGKPIGPIYFDHHSLILTQNYIMGFRTQDSNPNYSIFYYTPEYKEKFDKLLGKTKTAEKRECEVTHPPIGGKIKNLTPHRDTPEEGTYVL